MTLLSIMLLSLVTVSAGRLKKDALLVAAGDAPRSARVTGPRHLTDLGKGTYSKWVGCSYSIDWGDGTVSPSGPAGADCALGLSHTYRNPGTYRIKAKTFHPAPDDHHIDDWSDSITFKAK